MKNAALRGKPDAGNPHVRFDEGEVAPAKPRRGSLLYNWKTLSYFAAVAALVVAFVGTANARDLGPYEADQAIEIGEITEASTIAIQTGVTVTNTTAITGSGSLKVLGGGTLKLATESPDYSGEVTIADATVTVSTSNPFGSTSAAKVTILGYSEMTNVVSRLTFVNTTAIEFPNEIYIKNAGSDSSTLYGYGYTAAVTFGGQISADSYVHISDSYSKTDRTTPRMIFTQPVTVGNNMLSCGGAGAYCFSNKVTAATLYSSGGGSPESRPHIQLAYAQNAIKRLDYRWNAKMSALCEGAFDGSYIEPNQPKKTGYFSMGAYDQSVLYLSCEVRSSDEQHTDINGTDGATLTITGNPAATKATSATAASTLFGGNMNLVLDDKTTKGFTQTISAAAAYPRASGMTGSITVKKGTLQMTGPVTFKSVANVVISGGSLSVSATSPNLFGAEDETVAVAKFSDTGKMNIAEGLTVYVYQAMTNGVWLDAGTYTGEGGATGTVIPQLTGIGALVVRDGTRTFEITESGDIDIMGLMAGSTSAACVLNIAADVVVTNTTALSGNHPLTVQGGGRLALKEDSSAYNCAIYVGLGQLWVQAEGALGSGVVTIQGRTNAGGISRVVFDLGSSSGTFDNDFVIESSAASDGNSQIGFNRPVSAKQYVFNGDFTSAGDIYATDVAAAYDSSATERICFKGAVRATGSSTWSLRCGAGFYGPVKASYFYANSNAATPSQQFNAYFYSQTNEVSYLMNRKYGKFHFCTNDICKDAYYRYGDSAKDGGLIMHGYDQRFKYLQNHSNYTAKFGCVSSDSAATLTLYGGDAAVSATACQVTLNDAVSLVIDQAGDAAYSQTFYNAVHTMNGSITVMKGTLNFTGPSTLAKVPEVSVTGGTLNMQSTADQAFKAVTTLSLSGGLLAVSETSTNLFGTAEATKAVAEFSGTGTMNIAAGRTVYVSQAMTNDVWLKAGTYTGEAGVEGAVVIPQLTGSGVLSVQHNGTAGTVLFIR